MRTRLSERKQAILAAVEAGKTSLEDIGQAAGISSRSLVRSYVHRLAEQGELALESHGSQLRVASGAEFVAGWDLAARLAGNDQA